MLHVRPIRLRSSRSFHYVTATRTVYRNARPAPVLTLPSTVESENGRHTLRQRRHGESSLPLPPLLDPVAIEATSRYRGSKALKPEGGKTAFQRELHMNPYGTAHTWRTRPATNRPNAHSSSPGNARPSVRLHQCPSATALPAPTCLDHYRTAAHLVSSSFP